MELTEAELKIRIKEAVDAATEEATEGLKKKNSELLGKLKAAQKDSLITPEAHATLQAELDAAQNKLAEAQKVAKDAMKEVDKIKKQYETESKVAHNLLVENGLSSALLEAGVKNPAYQKAAKAMLAGQVVLANEGETRVAKVGDKLLKEFVAEWSKSDEGKAFVDAPGNSGGGATGGGQGGGHLKSVTRAIFDSMNETARMDHIKAGGGVTA